MGQLKYVEDSKICNIKLKILYYEIFDTMSDQQIKQTVKGS